MKICYILIVTLLASACHPKKSNGEKTPEEISQEKFDGNYKVGDSYAIVYPMHHAFEVEIQFFATPVIFYFDSLASSGDFVYTSDDQSMSFTMEKDHRTGTFFEINEPPLKVVKE
ncbi:hypothetical protein N6H18_18325 [Reichenbachiella agarivorans]|uniref:DUF3471 domain-containing protein n=1 Tax=Reichenbachiella agarivorans TaxID=2979464 RepID=A0ABY6CP49_9BACT|nr:hypothetical protein [Reichenbachiella agarivorans]UXP32298.1 hypothetical protein N6H18_18325 [Reichenbachiella agarivorans]